MYTIIRLTTSSLKMFLRNRQAIFFTLFTPIIIMTIFGFLALDRVPKVDIGIAVTTPPTKSTQRFIDQLENVPALNVKIGAERDERVAIEKGDRSVVLIIPGDFFPEGQFTQPKRMTILTNASDPQQSSTAASIIRQILDKTTLSVTQAPTLFSIDEKPINSRNLKYIDFLVPGVMAMAIMQMCVFSVAFVFADYKEKGVLRRLIATPMRPYQFVTANVVTRLIVAVVQAAFLLTVGVLIFKAQVIGSYWLILPIVILGAVMFLGLGFTISGFANTVEAVPALANLIAFPMLFLGGTFFPIDTMPDWLQHIAKYLPLSYLSDSLRQVMIHGATLTDVKSDLLWMTAWSVALVVAANFSFGMESKRQ